MSQRSTLRLCRLSGMINERTGIRAAIEKRQAKHKAVAGLQARLKDLTNEILKMEMGK